MAATVISANEVDIADGILVAEGCTAEITHGTVEAMAIDNGTQGMLRTDLIVARYTRNSGTGIEDIQLAVIKGTPAASNPATPSHTTGSIAEGDTTVDFPLYEVHLDGISIDSVTRLVDVICLVQQSAFTELSDAVSALSSKVTALETKASGIVRTNTYSVAAGAVEYRQLLNVATYILVIDSAYNSDTLKGIYLIGMTGTGTIGIKTVSAASDVVVTDSVGGRLKITNNGSAILRCTLITTYVD